MHKSKALKKLYIVYFFKEIKKFKVFKNPRTSRKGFLKTLNVLFKNLNFFITFEKIRKA